MTLHCTRAILYLATIFAHFQQAFAAMTFPIHVGGFTGNTEIHQMAYDPGQNFGIAGVSWDTAIVTNPNSNFVMYLLNGGNTWLWKKQFGCPASTVSSMAMVSDKVALVTSSTMLIVLDNNGNIIRQQKDVSPSFTCTPVCKLFFHSNGNLYFFATTTTSPKALYGATFDASLPAGASFSYYKWAVTGVDIQFLDSSIGEWQIFISTQYGASQSTLLNYDPSLTSMNWKYRFTQNGPMKKISSLFMSSTTWWDNFTVWSNMQVLFTYSETSANEWYFTNIRVNSDTDFIFRQQSYIGIPSTWTNCKAIEFRTVNRQVVYLLSQIWNVASVQLIIWQVTITYDHEPMWTCACSNCACPYWDYGHSNQFVNYLHRWAIVAINPDLVVNGGYIFDWNNYLIVGYSSSSLYNQQGGALSPYKVSFAWNPHPDLNILIDDPVMYHHGMVMSWGPGLGLTSLVLIPSTLSSTLTSPSCTIMNFLVPDTTLYTSVRQEYTSKKEPLENIYWLSHDTTARSLTPKILTSCVYQCYYEIEFEPTTPMPTGCLLADFYQANSSMLLYYTSQASGVYYNLTLKGTLPPDYACNILFKENSFRLELLTPTVLLNSAPAIPDQIYYIGESASVQTIPGGAYTHSLTGYAATYPLISTDTRLIVQYEILKADGTAAATWLTYDPITRSNSLSTTDNSFEGTYNMRVQSSFAYNTSVKFPMQTFNIILKNRCRKAVITPTQFTPITIYYQIGQPALIVPIPDWTYDTIPKQCGPFTYTLSVNLFPAQVQIYLDPSTGKQCIKLDSQASLDHMGSTSLILPTHYTVMTGTLYKPGTSNTDVFKFATMQLNYRMISIATSFILPPTVMTDATYTIKDPRKNHAPGVFTIVDAGGLLGVYELRYQSNLTIDTSIFTIKNTNLNQPKIFIDSADNDKIGVYYLYIRARFNINIPYFIDSKIFQITILHQCVRNKITGLPISTKYYNVSLPMLTIKIEDFKMTVASCIPIKYEAKLQSQASLPPYIKWDSKAMEFKIYSMSDKAVGSYQITLTGKTIYYDINSDNFKYFEIKIGCLTRTVKTKIVYDEYSFQLGKPGQWSYTFDKMDPWPFCGTPEQVMQYTVKLQSGVDLPTGILFAPLTRKLTFTDDGSIIAGTLNILIIGQALDSNKKNTLLLAVNVIESNSLFMDSNMFEKLPMIVLSINPGETQDFQSQDFQNYTSGQYQIIKGDPKGMKFVQAIKQQAIISPTIKDIGSHIIRLFGYAKDGGKYMQEVIIKVGEVGIYKEVIAKIVKISRGGSVKIQFNQPMVIPGNISTINNETLELKIKNIKIPKRDQQIAFIWKTQSFDGTILYLNMNFSNPFLVSQPDPDDLEIHVLDRDIFLSKTGVLIGSNYLMKEKIPKQMDSSKESKYVDGLGLLLQDKIDAFSSQSVFFNVIFGFVMTRLWGMITSMQIIVLIPLLSVDIPQNIQLVYQFISGNMNFQIVPVNLQSLGIFDFNNTNDTAFTPYFEDNGYNSLYVVQNVNENFMNLLSVLLCTSFFQLVDLIMRHFGKQMHIY